MMKKKSNLWHQVCNHKILLLFMLPAVLFFIVFSYAPMYGLVIAFQEFSPVAGFSNSPFVGLQNFIDIFKMPDFTRALRNTLLVNGLKIVLCFPAPIIFALLLNEIKNVAFKKTVQTISYLPYFISWVVASGLWYKILTIDNGPVNSILMSLGLVQDPVYFTGNPALFYPLIIATEIWKNLGWNAIIYLAALSAIDPGIYEAARVDGAGRLRQMWHISLPGIRPAISMMFIFTVAGLMNSDFDQMYTMGNAAVREVGDVLDTLILRVLQTGAMSDYSYGTAMGLFKNLIGFGLFLMTNFIFKKLTDESII